MLLERTKVDIIENLRTEIFRLQGFKQPDNNDLDLGLGHILSAFPNATFPFGAIHEFLAAGLEDTTASSGFIAGLLSRMMGHTGISLWISASRTLFPPALRNFGVQPDRFIFIDLQKEKHVMWAMEEALKCGAITAVVGEMQEISFTSSRRLQLAVEQSQVTGFILRHNCKKLTTTACVSRWRITSLESEIIDGLPGIGFPKWRLELLRIRNGKPGVWDLVWKEGRFHPLYNGVSLLEQSSYRLRNVSEKRKAG